MDEDSLTIIFIYDLLDIITMNNTIDLGVAIIQRWHNETIKRNDITIDEDNDENSFDWHPILYTLLAILLGVLIILTSYKCYK